MDTRRGRPHHGLKRSKPAHNIEGRTERELMQQQRLEKGKSSRLKKRHRKDLSAEEIDAVEQEQHGAQVLEVLRGGLSPRTRGPWSWAC